MAVSVDAPELSKKVVDTNRLSFSILSDRDGSLMKQLGIVHAGAGPGGTDIATPAQFLFDGTGKLVWQFISRRTAQRAHPDEVLRQVQSLAD